MQNLFAAILAKGIGFQLKQGLYREYRNCQEDLFVMRGKINMQGTIRNKMSRRQLLACEFDELSENNLLNQILKSTVLLLLKHGNVKARYKDDLKKKMLFFSAVDTLELTSVRWSAIRFGRNNQNYRMLISICQLLAEGLLLTTEQGEYRLAAFLDEQRMCRILRPADDEAAPHGLDKGSDFVSRRGAEAQPPPLRNRECAGFFVLR